MKNEANKDQKHPLELFFAGLPPFTFFRMEVDEVTEMLSFHPDQEADGEILLNKANELAIIGIVSYFEAFCKHQFAACIHCCPIVLTQFSNRRQQASVPIRDLVHAASDFHCTIGYIIAEQYDFGSPKQINGLFSDLLGVTPINRDEAIKLEAILNDRHLLVHHSGVYTLNYARERSLINTTRGGVFWDSLLIDSEYYKKTRDFFVSLAEKIVRVTHAALADLVDSDESVAAAARLDALAYLLLDLPINLIPPEPGDA